MATFPIKSAYQLADFIIPMTVGQAQEVVRAAHANGTNYSDAALYYTNREGKRESVRVSVTIYDDYMIGSCDEYHPRKDGKAEFIYR